jgi:polyferredoxin
MIRLLALLIVGWLALPLQAADVVARYPQAHAFFPDSTHVGEREGSPPAAAVYRDRQLLGYLIQTFDVIRIPAYSGRPINTLIGVDRAGRITGVEIVHHEEPILGAGVSEEQLAAFAAQYRGKSALDRFSVGAARPGYVEVDAISGATITVMVENASIQQTVRALAESRAMGVRGARAAAPAAGPASQTQPEPAPDLHRAGDGEPVWVAVWQERRVRIAVLVAGLTLLTLILVFQDWLTRRPVVHGRLRLGFLFFTLFFIGWYALAQLSVVNVLTFVHAVMRDFRWESFLIEPLLFILWAYVAVTLLLWGRGVYCGWLCPFGALQELAFRLARKLRLPHFEMPQMIHERLWALKYVILIVLFGVSLQSLSAAERLAEVEPFKTAITLRWQREWTYVLFAAAFVAIAVFNRKFYCKYLCPLGAALTFPARFRIFDWLRRHRECGRPCQICAVECEVQAVKKNGEINPNECHYCMDCQMSYWDEHKCPPMVERRRRRERAGHAREVAHGMEPALGASGLTANAGGCGPCDPEVCRNRAAP